MKHIPLANTGKTTTQLGFGCAFPPSVDATMAARSIEAAYDAGIRHFDVAPSYSDGNAEVFLGRFLKTHHDVTVTTKYGILPSAMRPLHVRAIRAALRPVLQAARTIPAVKQGLAKSAQAMNVSSKAAFEAAQAKESLESSLRKLGRDRVDLFLLHEPSAGDLAPDRGLLPFLQDCVAAKRIGAFGVGGDASRVASLYAERRAFCDVMQFNWTAFSPDIAIDSFRIHYWTFSHTVPALLQAFAETPGLAARCSDKVGLDLTAKGNLVALMLKAALVRFPDSLVLFTSSNADNMRRLAAVVDDRSLEEPARRLYDAAQMGELSHLKKIAA